MSSEKISNITIPIRGNDYNFDYSISKTSDEAKEDRYWKFTVNHMNDDLTDIPKKISFIYDTRDNIYLGKISGAEQTIAELILEKENL